MRDGDDTMTLLLIAAIGLAVIGPALAWQQITGWLVDHGVLVDSQTDPVIVVPASGGAGLDISRVTIIIALLAVSVCGFVVVRARRGAAS